VVDEHRWKLFNEKRDAVSREQERLQGIFVRPESFDKSDREILGAMQRECRAAELLRRPDVSYADLTALSAVGPGPWQEHLSDEQAGQVVQQLEVQARYEGYIERQQREIDKHARQESLILPHDIDYRSVTGLSTEACQRLQSLRPVTLGHASRLEGVTPSAVSLLLIHLRKRQLQRSA
jgi:tRNA uridine 5-carboxymethylaminomethyl modification enzyme